MNARKQRVLVLYGGDGGTVPRQELIAWLTAKQVLNVEPRQVSWNAPHSDATVSERVKREIDEADKAIAIVTKDVRSAYGAPNVIEEIGRWLQAKGGHTLCVIREAGTEKNSNVAGLIYLEFENRIREVFDELRDFLADGSSVAEIESKPARLQTVAVASTRTPPATDFSISTSSNWVLVASRPYRRLRVEETGSRVTATFVCDEPADEFAVRQLQQRSEVELAYSHHLAEGVLSNVSIAHEAQTTGTVIVTLREGYEQRARHQEAGWGGPDSLSSDEIAERRTSRLLTGEPKAKSRRAEFFGGGLEMMIRGMGEVQVIESAFPSLLANMDRSDRLAWELVRLELVRLLLITNCVERIDRLSLKIAGGKLIEIDFRGARHVYFGNEQFVVEVKQTVDY